MIYEVYLDGKLLYYPNDETYAIINSTLQLALNEAGSFEFDVPTYNLRYNDFKLRKSMIQVLQNGEEIFYGEVREVKTNADFTKHVYAVGELAFLFDSIQPQARYLTSPLNAFTQIIAKHNSQVEDRKKYTVSQVAVTDTDNQIYFYTNGEDTLSIIRQKICDVLDGYIRVTKDASGKRYISIVPLNFFGTCKQEIQFGENLLDYSCNMSASDIATCVVPRGAKIEDEDRTTNAVEGLDEYLTIKGTTADYYHKNKNDDFVQLDEAIANFGYVRVLKEWDNVTIAENLKKKATEWLKEAQYESMILELKALDMAQFDVNIDTFNIGESVHVWALPYGMDTSFPVRKKTIYLQDLEKNEVVLGNTIRQSYTDQASKVVEQLKEEIPELSPVLKQARDNALAMLTDPSKGFVSYIFDKDGNRTEIWIADSLIQSQMTRKWVWNSSGLGYMYKNSKGAWETNVAITMDGAIVADRIVSGSLKLAGGSSTISKAVLQVYEGATEIGAWSSGGIKINKGAINLGAIKDSTGKITDYYFKVDNNGNITATKGAIKLGAYTKSDGSTDYYFKVDNNGNLVCTKADVKGTINATGGYISGTLTVGGKDAISGTISVKNADDTEVAKLNNTGITAIGGNIGGFRIRKDRLDGGNDGTGIWIYPPYDSSKGIGDSRFPNGGMAVGQAGEGLIQFGYRRDGRNVIRLEFGSTVSYLDWDGFHRES